MGLPRGTSEAPRVEAVRLPRRLAYLIRGQATHVEVMAAGRGWLARQQAKRHAEKMRDLANRAAALEHEVERAWPS